MAQTRPATTAKTSTSPRSTQQRETNSPPVQFVFGRTNYRLFIASIAVVVLGFALMSGTTDIYSNTKIVLAPVVVLAGFALGFYAILKKAS